MCEEMALALRLPLIRLVEGSGGAVRLKQSKQPGAQMYRG